MDLFRRPGIGVRRERQYLESALALVHARAEWTWVASSGIFQPSGFTTPREKEALDKAAAYINPGGKGGKGKGSSSTSREKEHSARPLGDFIKPVNISYYELSPILEGFPLDSILSERHNITLYAFLTWLSAKDGPS